VLVQTEDLAPGIIAKECFHTHFAPSHPFCRCTTFWRGTASKLLTRFVTECTNVYLVVSIVAVIYTSGSLISRVAVGYTHSEVVALSWIDFNLLIRSECSEHEL
jgi:hypothetical protein